MITSACTSRYPEGEWIDACDTPSPSPASEATAILERALAQDRGAGISAAALLHGEEIWSGSSGVARSDKAIHGNTRMRIASLSKPLTAVAALRLADVGLLDIGAPIACCLADVPPEMRAITPYQLGTHTAGVRHYDFGSLSDSHNTTHYERLSQALPDDWTGYAVASPGSRFLYSSIGFNLLGAIVSRQSSQPFEAAVRSWVTQPAGLEHTTTDDARRPTPCRAEYFTVFFGRWRLPTLWRDNSDLYPSGGMLSTPLDIARFTETALYSDLISKDGRTLMWTRATLADGTTIGRSFGWEIRTDANGAIDWIGHGGTTNGAYASVRHYPRLGLTVAAMSNYDVQFTDSRPAFFHAVRVALPALFSGLPEADFGD